MGGRGVGFAPRLEHERPLRGVGPPQPHTGILVLIGADASGKKELLAIADQVRTKLAALLHAAEADVLAYMSFPKEPRAKIHVDRPDRAR